MKLSIWAMIVLDVLAIIGALGILEIVWRWHEDNGLNGDDDEPPGPEGYL